MTSKWDACVVEDTRVSTNLGRGWNNVLPRIVLGASRSIRGRDVDPTVRLRIVQSFWVNPQESDVAMFAPERPPRVSNQPVVLTCRFVRSVTLQDNQMIYTQEEEDEEGMERHGQ
jgi:hypothetical protein